MDRVLRLNEVCQLIGVSRHTIWRHRRDGDFPKPIRIGRQCLGWRAGQIEAWIDSRQVNETPAATG